MEEKNKKKTLIAMGIGVLTLVLLTVGATFAYFTVNSTNQFGSLKMSASTGAIGGVTLTKVGDGLTLDVSAIDMLDDKVGTDYHASGSEEPAQMGKISVNGAGTYNCSYTLQITKSASSEENDLYNKFQSAEYTNKGEGQIYLDVNEQRYDFNTPNLFPITYDGVVNGITSEEDKYITANLTIANTNIDQTYLNDADITLTFEVTTFKCEYVAAEEETTTDAEAFAVYSADDNSLNFYKRSVPTVGDTFEGKTVTAVYTGIEDTEYSTSTMPEWVMSDYIESISSVSVVDKISPISTFLWFGVLSNCTTIDIDNLDTSNVTVMSNMFDSFGTNVETINLDLSNLDTSKVTNMSGMFVNFGSGATTINLNVSNWDLSNLLRSSTMFNKTGQNATSVTITGLDTWNTSNITNMLSMFDAAGQNATTFNIGDISGWNTSKAAIMMYMFRNAGVNADWSLDLSGWQVPLVTDYSGFNTGVESKVTAPTWVN